MHGATVSRCHRAPRLNREVEAVSWTALETDRFRTEESPLFASNPARETSTRRTRCRAILISAFAAETFTSVRPDRPLLQRAGSLRPIHASASEVVELSDRGRCDNIASRERVFVTYVIQLGVTHVLPLRFRHRGGSALGLLFHVPYFAIAARITAKLKTNPVSAMNLDTS